MFSKNLSTARTIDRLALVRNTLDSDTNTSSHVLANVDDGGEVAERGTSNDQPSNKSIQQRSTRNRAGGRGNGSAFSVIATSEAPESVRAAGAIGTSSLKMGLRANAWELTGSSTP